MPPKGAPRGASQRGRGRGRGKQTTEDSSASTSTPELAQPQPNPQETSMPMHDGLPRIVDDQPSPNSSPADAPTETPAPTPVRAPVQRLDSITQPTRGGTAARSSVSKFRPKNRRRDQEERDKTEQEERARQVAKNQAAAKAAGLGIAGAGRGDGRGRGRGRGTARGRGDAMGSSRGGLQRASGPFGAAPAAGMFILLWDYGHNCLTDPVLLCRQEAQQHVCTREWINITR